ncbi:MAG: TolC family protein [Porphyromonadaceae bacterium]|nr:TolC family protein [Porphyromonadaceae bacterium]
MKKIFLYFITPLIPLSIFAQRGYEEILKEISVNNTSLIALREQIEAEKIGNKTGIFLPNPEVEFNYLWGSPKEIGKRTDIHISQSFDFPTVYGHRKNIAELQNENAELIYKSRLTDILLTARQTIVEIVYYNALIKEYSIRLENSERIAETYRIRLDKGDGNIIEYNKAMLNLTAIQAETAKLKAEQVALLSELRRLNGGKEIAIIQDSYNSPMLPADFEEWYASVEAKNPILQYVKGEIVIGKERMKLNRAMSLPKFSTGYISERVVGETFQGVSLGVSIPLWENKNMRKYAQAQVKASEIELDNSKVQFYNRLKSLFQKALVLQQNALKFRQTISDNKNDELLKKALDSGEISLLNYLQEIGFYYDAMLQVLHAERDYELALAELYAVENIF